MASPGYRSVQSDRSNHLTELETRIQNLADNSQRDDVKLKMLQVSFNNSC